MSHGDDQTIRTPQIKQKHRQPADQQRDRQKPGQSRKPLIGQLVEHRRGRGHIKRPGSGDDQKHRKHMRNAPHHLIVHAGHHMTVMLHIEGGGEAYGDNHYMQNQQVVEKTIIFTQWRILFGHLIVSHWSVGHHKTFRRLFQAASDISITNAWVQVEVGAHLLRRHCFHQLGYLAVRVVKVAKHHTA